MMASWAHVPTIWRRQKKTRKLNPKLRIIAMAIADIDGREQVWQTDDELEDRDAVPAADCHPAGF